MSDWFRGDAGELIEVRYLDIPGLPPDEVDEIICGPLHLETTDTGRAYLTVAGLMVRVVAIKRGQISITVEPDTCTPIDAPPGGEG